MEHSKKPIVFAVNDLDFGGAQRTVIEEANELVRRGIPTGIVVTLLGAKMGLSANLDARVRILKLEFRSLYDVVAYQRLVRFWRETKPHAVISNLFFTNTVVRISKILVPSLSVFVREGNVLVEKSFVVKIVDLFLSLLTARVFVNARALVKPIKRVNPFTKVTALYNGIDESFFKSSLKRVDVRASLHVPDDAFVAVVIGSLTEKKGHTHLIDALKLLPDTYCLIVGEGYMRAELEKRASEHIRFLGARRDVRELFAASDVFVLPSLWEGMPNAILEALAAGLPVVATNVGGVSEIVRNDENGFLVPTCDAGALAEKLQRLIDDRDLRARLSHNASKSVRHLTWQSHADQLLFFLGSYLLPLTKTSRG